VAELCSTGTESSGMPVKSSVCPAAATDAVDDEDAGGGLAVTVSSVGDVRW